MTNTADWTDYHAYYATLSAEGQGVAWAHLSPEQRADFELWLRGTAPVAAPAVAAQSPDGVSLPGAGNAFSLRVLWGAIWGALFGGGGLALLLSLLWAPLQYSAWVFIPAVFVALIGAAMTGPPVVCPACLKRIKMGANTCHHCGHVTPV